MTGFETAAKDSNAMLVVVHTIGRELERVKGGSYGSTSTGRVIEHANAM